MKKEYRLLIELYLQDNCSEEQLQQILNLVDSDDEFRGELAEAGRLQGLLYTIHKDDYEGLNKRIQKSIAEMDSDSLEMNILSQLEDLPQKSSLKKWSPLLWLAIAAQIIIVLMLPQNTDNKSQELASLYSESDKAWLIRDGIKSKITAKMRLLTGDEVVVDHKGDLRITWNDSTVTEFKDLSAATFKLVDGAKYIHMNYGKLLARVTKQPEGKALKIITPNSTATVLGTRFMLKVYELESMLEVKRGRVRFTRNSDGKSVVVTAHEYAVSSPSRAFKVLKTNSAIYKSHEVSLDTKDRRVDIVAELNGSEKLYLVVHDGSGGNAFDHAAWLMPRLEDSQGRQLLLTDLQWAFTESEWGKMGLGIDADGNKLKYQNRHYPNGIGTHAVSIIEYDLPQGYHFFKATGVITDSGSSQKASLSSLVFEVYTEFPGQRYRKIMLRKGKN